MVIICVEISDIPLLSEIEEARALQYQCECIETACIDRGMLLSPAPI